MPLHIESSVVNGDATASNGVTNGAAAATRSNGHHSFDSARNDLANLSVSDQDEEQDKRRDALDYPDDEKGFKPLWPGSELDRRELVRLALQTFKEMGYTCADS